MNFLVVVGNIINPLLISLLERIMFSEECKKDAECDVDYLLGEEADESEVIGESKRMSDDEYGPPIEIEIDAEYLNHEIKRTNRRRR